MAGLLKSGLQTWWEQQLLVIAIIMRVQIFKTLLDQVDDEICGAKEYAELALSLKDESPQLSSMYNDLSKQEYSHIQILHSHLLKVYESFGEQTDIVQSLFDWQNKKLIDGAAHVKTLIDMYK